MIFMFMNQDATLHIRNKYLNQLLLNKWKEFISVWNCFWKWKEELLKEELFNVYTDGLVREVNVRVLGKGLGLLSANGGRFEIDQLLFADDTALVTDSKEKLCRLESEYGRVCERRKLRVNVGKRKVMWCSRYGNGGRMHEILNGEPLEEVDCFKYLGSQVAADRGCERDFGVQNE